MFPSGLAVLGMLLLLKPAHGRAWPFLLLLPVIVISAVFAFVTWQGGALSNFVQRDSVFQVLLAVRFASAILMVALASDRRFAAGALGLAALLADPLLFNFAACGVGSALCR